MATMAIATTPTLTAITPSAAFKFPFGVTPEGGIVASTDPDETIRGKVIQVLFTAPGERVNLPEFGCGLFNLVFEPNNTILAAAMEFTVGAALTRWLRDDILLDGVNVDAVDERVTIEIAYTKRRDLTRQALRVHFK